MPKTISGVQFSDSQKDHINSRFTRSTDGCWPWLGAKNNRGYGKVSVGGRTLQAHRAVREMLVGPISEGMVIDHICSNRMCVNPEHLEVVTHEENIRRGYERGRRPGGISGAGASITHCRRGHEFTPDNTRIEGSGARRCRTCARDRMRVQRADERA